MCHINKLSIDDDPEGYLHFEAIARRMYEPDKTAPRFADVRDKVVFTCRRGHPTPRSNGKVCAGYNGNGCASSRLFSVSLALLRLRMKGLTLVLMNETVQVCIVSRV